MECNTTNRQERDNNPIGGKSTNCKTPVTRILVNQMTRIQSLLSEQQVSGWINRSAVGAADQRSDQHIMD